MKLIRIAADSIAKYGEKIASLEKLATYPLGTDFFKIDHGQDYFAFFSRLGEMHYYAAVDETRDGAIAAVAAGIIRSRPLRTWYLCDLKVHPDYRGRRLPLWMLKRAFFQNYIKCPRGYAISMNVSEDRPNRVAKILEQFRWVPIRAAERLLLYKLDAKKMIEAAEVIERHRGPVSYLSLRGIKDIVLQSTGQPMPLVHVQFGPCAERAMSAPQEGSVHMFCVPERDSAFLAGLGEAGLTPASTATIVQHRMTEQDWSFVLTSDI